MATSACHRVAMLLLGPFVAAVTGNTGKTAGRSARSGVPSVALWADRELSGNSAWVPCCGEVQLQPLLKARGVGIARSISVLPGVRATFRSRQFGISSDHQPRFFNASADLKSLEDVLTHDDYCCESVVISPSSDEDYSEEHAVYIYDEEDFQGASRPFAEGDYEKLNLTRIVSVRVPAGFKITIQVGKRPVTDAFADDPVVLRRDTRRFPMEDTNPADTKPPALAEGLHSIFVRKLQPDDVHGLWVYFEPDFRGRPSSWILARFSLSLILGLTFNH